MINLNNMTIALNRKGSEVATGLSVDVCFGGFDLSGNPYKPSPDKDYIRFDLIPNDIERRGLANGESEVMLNGIYQATINIARATSKNPLMQLSKVIDLVRTEFNQGLNLSHNAQSCTIYRSDVEVDLSNETHLAKPVSVYFNCIF